MMIFIFILRNGILCVLILIRIASLRGGGGGGGGGGDGGGIWYACFVINRVYYAHFVLFSVGLVW